MEKPGKHTSASPAHAQAPALAPSTAAVLPPDPCKLYPLIKAEPPLLIPTSAFMLTRIVKSCVTRDGERGYEETTPFIVMGFPCTGGGGKINIKGNYYNPKMVAFLVATSCPMSPSAPDVVKKAVLQATGLSEKSMLMAHNPFAVQYWEIPSMSEADTGFSVELRSAASLEGTWKRMREKGEPLVVRLYGRENAWVQGDHFYEVNAELKVTERTGFQLKTVGVKSLTAEDIQTVKSRCEALRPRRNCLGAF